MSAEAKYRAMAITTAELTWLSYILRDIGLFLSTPPVLYCDNLSTLSMTINPVFHACTKHIELDYHFVHEKVALESLTTKHVSSSNQIADVFTKGLPSNDFHCMVGKMGMRDIYAPS